MLFSVTDDRETTEDRRLWFYLLLQKSLRDISNVLVFIGKVSFDAVEKGLRLAFAFVYVLTCTSKQFSDRTKALHCTRRRPEMTENVQKHTFPIRSGSGPRPKLSVVSGPV